MLDMVAFIRKALQLSMEHNSYERELTSKMLSELHVYVFMKLSSLLDCKSVPQSVPAFYGLVSQYTHCLTYSFCLLGFIYSFASLYRREILLDKKTFGGFQRALDALADDVLDIPQVCATYK